MTLPKPAGKPTIAYESELILRDFDGHTMFALAQDFSFTVDSVRYTCPIGMITDGASIPRWLWAIIGSPLFGKYRRACIPHDAGYQGQLVATWTDPQNGHTITIDEFSKHQIDTLFLALMEHAGVGPIKRKLMYRAVRWFGRGIFER